MSRRQRVSEFYRQPQNTRLAKATLSQLKEKAAASANRYAFHGAQKTHAVVVRCDLNGFTKWSNQNSLEERVALLDDFFSFVFSELEFSGGIYFRDEGDCFIALFSSYFGTCDYAKIKSFSQSVVARKYGKEKLSAKVCIACGDIAIYQKAHEVGSDDWSADGEAFVNAARLEQAIESKPQVYFFADEYDEYFNSVGNWAGPGEIYHWLVRDESKQVAGLGNKGGWEDIKIMEHIPGGKISEFCSLPRYNPGASSIAELMRLCQ